MDEDILEYALNHGYKSAANKFDVPIAKVYNVVNKFYDGMYYLCTCDYELQTTGASSMCFQCDNKKRLKANFNMKTWIKCSDQLPPDGVVVDTKVHDSQGRRNEQPLRRQGNLWFLKDGSVYVYYTPTHWSKI